MSFSIIPYYKYIDTMAKNSLCCVHFVSTNTKTSPRITLSLSEVGAPGLPCTRPVVSHAWQHMRLEELRRNVSCCPRGNPSAHPWRKGGSLPDRGGLPPDYAADADVTFDRSSLENPFALADGKRNKWNIGISINRMYYFALYFSLG